MNSSLIEAIQLINNTDNICIASHVNPDGDNIGSILALGHALKKLGKNINIIKTDEVPSDYLFLPNVDFIKEYDADEIELLIVLDCSDIERLGASKQMISKSKKVVNIDHHVSNTNFGDVNIVDVKAAATGELIYEFIKEMGISIDIDIATCLYTAISTDTGSFMYESVTDKTHEIAADLIRTGIDKLSIVVDLYQSRSMERTNLFVDCLSTFKTYHNNKIATVIVTQDMLKRANAKMEDTEGIISFVKDTKGVEVACLLKEHNDNEIKISLRSKEFVNVAKVCASFNGGGHIRAAGCTIHEKIEAAEKQIVTQLINMW